MSLSSKIREQLISSFRAELAEHVQTMTNGLLAIEQGQVAGDERQELLNTTFRAAHSLKGAARAVGVTVIEELAHALENVLELLRSNNLQTTPAFFNACYQTLDAIQAVQTAYEAGETTPPIEALQALNVLGQYRSGRKDAPATAGAAAAAAPTVPAAAPAPAAVPDPAPLAAPAPAAVEPTPPPAPRPAAPPPAQKNGSFDPVTSVSQKNGLRSDALKNRLDELFTQPAADEPAASSPSEASVQAVASPPPPAQPAAPTPPPAPTPAPAPAATRPNPPPAEPTRPPARSPIAGAAELSASASPDGDETIRVKVGKLDTLMAQLSELLVIKIRTEQRLTQVQDFQELINVWQKDWQNARNAFSRLMRRHADGNGLSGLGKDELRLLEYVSDNQDRLREAKLALNNLAREYANDTTQMSLAIDELEQEVKRLRMLPLLTITASFGRMVRDLAQSSGKEVTLSLIGGETELDKHVLEQIKDPLIHLLRNAVDHGIEAPDVRRARGKPAVGTITLRAEQIGKDVIITVSDDGAGIDLEAVRRSVVRQGRIDAQSLTELDLKEYMFKSGISSSTIITDISGRGVGLDVVQRNIEALHGRVDVNWQEGVGSIFSLVIPLRLTGSRGLLVRTAGQTLAIPITAVEYILSVRPEEITQLEGHDTIRYNGRSMALVRLSDVLGLPRLSAQRFDMEIPVIILTSSNRFFAFAVDELVGEQEIVIKGLGRQIQHVGGVTGATVMGSGEVVIILNAGDLIKLALRSERRAVLETARLNAPTEMRQQRRILIVDDSITTRTLEKNILEAAGYQVQIATDGQEALNSIATNGVPDLVVSDIAMPRIDGFELTRRIKNSPQTAEIPVILVSSLDSPEDKARGIEAGADAYITKGRFDQNNLLDTIEQMLVPLNA